jgi:His/Glu/Gln/Arg/opine family amino acid ABC transporter permease subunit
VASVEAPLGTGPPDTRGPTAPLPAFILVIGAAALALVILGTLALQASAALGGEPLSPACVALDLRPDVVGSTGVCHIVEALKSPAQTGLLVVGLLLGGTAVALGLSTYRRMDSRRKRHHALTGAIIGVQGILLALVILWFRNGRPDRFAFHFLNFERLRGYAGAFLTGARNTMLLAFVGEVGGIVIGLILAIMTISQQRAVRAPARAYINFFRGTPLIWQLSVFYFGFSLGLDLKLAAYRSAMIVFALNTGAYASEVFRAGIQSIERGQIEAARSLGMTYLQAMRYAIVPQAVRRVIPPLLNEFVILIKDTSLILVLGLLGSELDLYSVAREGYAATFNATFYVAAAAGYLAVTLPLIRAVNIVEARLRSGLVGVNVGQQ